MKINNDKFKEPETPIKNINRYKAFGRYAYFNNANKLVTSIFDIRQARKGYFLNKFCKSLTKAENRQRFKQNERAYLDEYGMTENQKLAVLNRDLNLCISLGGNIYFLSKIGLCDGKNFQQIVSSMTELSYEEYQKMMLNGGRKS